MTLYMKTTTDKYELPIAVADSPKKLAMMLGQKRSSVATMCSQQRNGYHRIEVEPEWRDMTLEMTEKEIVRNYRASRNKKQQIEILADLNNTTKDIIKAILKENGVDLRGGNYRAKKPATINQDFEDAVNEMIEQSEHKPLPEIEAADPVPGEVGYRPMPEVVEKKPPLGIPPRQMAEMMFNEKRIQDIVYAMHRYYEADMDIPLEWRTELKERL